MSIAIVRISSVAIAAFSILLFAAAPAFAEQHSRLKLLVGPDKICVKPTQCFTSKPDPGNAKVVTTCEDTESKGGCSSFAVACIYGGGTYEGNNNKGKCTTN